MQIAFQTAADPYNEGMTALLAALIVVIPPTMATRSIAPWTTPYPGEKLSMTVGVNTFTLYIPNTWKPQQNLSIQVHFHGPDWHMIQESIDRGSTDPLISSYAGEGSTVYKNLMIAPGTLESWLAAVMVKLKERGAPSNAIFNAYDLTSFSAGYGAIRELVQQPTVFKRIRKVVLGDSMYGSLQSTNPRVPLDAHITVWEPLARAAMRGDKTFVVSVSSVPTSTYASSSECLDALVKRVGGSWANADPTWPCSQDPSFPLLRYFESRRFFAWHYGGSDAAAHNTQARHFADIWKAIDPPRPKSVRDGS